MALTPDDIINHEFRQTMRGYAVAEVDDLLDRLADQVERNERDLAELRQRLEADAVKLAEAQRNETALTQTLVTAQQTAQSTVQDAEERAAIIESDARSRADELVAEAAREAAATTSEARAAAELMRAETEWERGEIRARLEQLVATERRHRDDLRAHLERQLAALDERGDGPSADALRTDGADEADRGSIEADGPRDTPGSDVPAVDVVEHGWGDLRDVDQAADAGHDDAEADSRHAHGA